MALIATAVWVGRFGPPNKVAVLVVIGASSVAVARLLRTRATRRFPPVSDAVFVASCGCSAERTQDVLAARAVIARTLEIATERLSAATRLGELAATTAWFGADSLALEVLQAQVDRRTGGGVEVSSAMSVGELVRLLTLTGPSRVCGTPADRM